MTYNMELKTDRLKLASAFRAVAADFQRLCNEHNLEHTLVAMHEAFDMREYHQNLCETPACHGGWAAIMYGVEIDEEEDDEDSFFIYGGEMLAEKLGFGADRYALQAWAHKYPEYWGNEYGAAMFNCSSAFGQSAMEDFPLPIIYKHYLAVAERLERG